MLIDSHCHLTHPKYDGDRAEVLARARGAGVGGVITVSSCAGDGPRIRGLLEGGDGNPEGPRLWGTAGIHPHESGEASEGDLDRIREAARGPGVVAVGETGLDFHYDFSPRDTQELLFRGHLELAEELGLPVVVHARNADSEMVGILKEWGPKVRGVLHCFSGGEALLDRALEVGWMISFTGIVTFKSYGDHTLVRKTPEDRLMVETDGPYLAPIPHRGRRNEPSFVPLVADALARIREEDPESVGGYTTENADSFFGLGL